MGVLATWNDTEVIFMQLPHVLMLMVATNREADHKITSSPYPVHPAHCIQYTPSHTTHIRSLFPSPQYPTTTTTSDSILTLKWKDKRDVLMLSTYHNSSMVTKTRRSRAAVGSVEDIQKPQVVEDYNQNMGGVDKSKLPTNHLHFTCMWSLTLYMYVVIIIFMQVIRCYSTMDFLTVR